jgi:hypothetical protein
MSTTCGNSNTLFIKRPSQAQFDSACAGSGGGVTMKVVGGGANCDSNGGCPSDLKPRKNREAVREKIQDYVLTMLGASTVKVELTQQAMDIIIDRTLQVFEDYAGREFYDYYTFDTTPGKSVYQLPPEIGIVRNVFYKEMGTFAFQASDLGGAIPVEYFYPGGAYASIQGGLIDPIQPIWGRMGEWTLYKQYEQMFSRVSSNLGGWEFIGGLHAIKLYPTPCRCSRVMVHYLQKCKDWKEVNQAMQDGALAHAMIALGHIRGKYSNPPGGVQLDGDYMRTKGWELLEKWQEDLLYRFGELPYITMG